MNGSVTVKPALPCMRRKRAMRSVRRFCSKSKNSAWI